MGIAFAVAIVAMSFLALDAVTDVNSSAIAKRIEVARASIADAVMGQAEPAFAVQAWARGGHEGPALAHCLAIDSSTAVSQLTIQ
jgi:hypothetical protein